MPSASALVRARPDQVFLGPRDGNCQNCGVRWGGHAGIRCHTTPYNPTLLCPWCDRVIENHSARDCVHHKQAFTLPPEFVELWGEIGRAHAAAVYLEPAYVPKVWPKATLQAAKLAGLAGRVREMKQIDRAIRGMEYHTIQIDEVALPQVTTHLGVFTVD